MKKSCLFSRGLHSPSFLSGTKKEFGLTMTIPVSRYLVRSDVVP